MLFERRNIMNDLKENMIFDLSKTAFV
ncbi:isochorismatase, partial [Enterococcus faecium]